MIRVFFLDGVSLNNVGDLLHWGSCALVNIVCQARHDHLNPWNQWLFVVAGMVSVVLCSLDVAVALPASSSNDQSIVAISVASTRECGMELCGMELCK